RSAAEEGIRLASDFGHSLGASWNLTVVALLDALRGDEPGARHHADEAIELAATGGGTFILSTAEWALGQLELTLGRPGEATDRLYGEWLRRERQRREARRHLRRAADLFRRVGAPPWEERAEAELRPTGETARRRDPSTLDQLTPQELQVAGLVAAGMTNRQI